MNSTNFVWRSAITDTEGRVALTNLVSSATYWIGAEQADPELGVLGGGEKVRGPSGGSSELLIELSAPRTSGVVISEVYMNAPNPWETGDTYYYYSTYIELANNSPTPVYLDGMLIFKAYPWWQDTGEFGHHRCDDTGVMRNDSLGVWSEIIWQIPGSGSEHLLGPGEAAVLAASAADHTGTHPTLLDLSDARFEFGVSGVADNPAAPDLIWRGVRPPVSNDFNMVRMYWGVASPGEVESFPIADDPGSVRGEKYRRIPAELIEDVAFVFWDRTGSYTQTPPQPVCDHPVHPSFDRLPGGFLLEEEIELSAHRRPVTVNGRSLLLDTNTSWVDFMKAERTPGRLP